ncbi:MAG TPA: hypothetical protein VGH66_01335 [Acidimicrobiales bacterium]|jgi:hypothetical protein
MADELPGDEDRDDYRDELPEELDVSGYVGPYSFPNNNRRRIAAIIYAVGGVGCITAYALRGDAVLVNRGFLVGGVALLLLAAYHVVSGVTLEVNETEALVVATRTVGFPIGHASAQLSWRGLLSRPTWRILLYSAEDPPTRRGLVLVDGVDGHVGDHFVEDNPEDWSSLDK